MIVELLIVTLRIDSLDKRIASKKWANSGGDEYPSGRCGIIDPNWVDHSDYASRAEQSTVATVMESPGKEHWMGFESKRREKLSMPDRHPLNLRF